MADMGAYTLSDAIFARSCIYVVCRHCGHFSIITYNQAGALGWQTPVSTIEKRFRCRSCGVRNATIQADRPAVGERTCPKCGAPTWKPRPMDMPAGSPRCSRCLRPMRR